MYKYCQECGNFYKETEFYYNKRTKQYYNFCKYCQAKDPSLTKKKKNKISKVISCRLPVKDIEKLLNSDVNASKIVKCIVSYAISHPKLMDKILKSNDI